MQFSMPGAGRLNRKALVLSRCPKSVVPNRSKRCFRKALCSAVAAGPNNHVLLKVAQEAAKAGAAVVFDALDKPRNISFKGATDLVTDTDRASEAAILAVIQANLPDQAILGEEGGIAGNSSSEYLWCIDPLDGTTNFAHGYPSFSVSVAVLHNGMPVAATVVEFAGGLHCWATRTFTAMEGGGAFCNGQPIHASAQADVSRSLLVTGFGYEHDAKWLANLQLFKHFTDVARGVRRLGAASVDLCHVALGIVEGYWEFNLKPWDTAAGVLIAHEAGATVTTMDGLPYTVFDRSMMAIAPNMHQQVLVQSKRWVRRLALQGSDFHRWYIPPGYVQHLGEPLGFRTRPHPSLVPSQELQQQQRR